MISPTPTRRCLQAGLWAGGGLTILLVAATVLWCLLAALGDAAGATVARVVALLVGICWLLDLAVLVAILALRQLAKDDQEELVE